MPQVRAPATPLTVLLIEPAPFNVQNLRKALRSFKLGQVGVRLLPYAVASYTGSAPFWDCSGTNSGAATESGTLDAKNPYKKHCKRRITVPVRTLDEIVQHELLRSADAFGNASVRSGPDASAEGPGSSLGAASAEGSWPTIDLLHIDAQGYDPDVLKGAARTLRHTAVVAFEYEDFWCCKASLKAVLEDLSGKGFSCWWAGQGRVWPMLQCWDPYWEEHPRWSNVVCARQGHVWHDVLKRLEYQG